MNLCEIAAAALESIKGAGGQQAPLVSMPETITTKTASIRSRRLRCYRAMNGDNGLTPAKTRETYYFLFRSFLRPFRVTAMMAASAPCAAMLVHHHTPSWG